MKVLLVPVANRPESGTAVNTAFGIAEKLDADVIGCHLRPHRDIGKDYKSRGLPLFGAPDEQALHEMNKKHSPAAVRAAEKLFKAAAEEAGFVLAKKARLNKHGLAIWQELVGAPDKLMSVAGPMADMTVVSRPAGKGQGLARTFVTEALLRTGRPVLVLPQKQPRVPGRKIAIAWNQSPEASRTIAACMPLLTQAEQVVVISCGSEDRRGPKSSQLLSYLRHWDIDAKSFRTLGRQEEKELLEAYKTSGSDLLLMGAYSRSRLREVVMGGMTEHMLWHENIPVILQHA